ncbi:MAG: AAA family ATPase [Nitrososphaerota archaeon]|nr:AAA family ATPase [Nitrososphaerota archaeon]
MASSDQPERPKEIKTHNVETSGVKLNITISKAKAKERPELVEKYKISNYDLNPGRVYSEKYKALIPKNTPEYVDRGEKYVERITRALYHFKQCALIGPSGTGKTHIVYLVAELAGLPLWEINCGLQTSVYDLFGRYVGLGKENWIDGQIVSWCRYGGILYLDEANMMKQDVATRLNPVLDTRGHLVLTEKDNEIIPRHPMGYVIISMNPYSAEFAGTKPLNAAFRRRMSVWIDFDYLSVGDKMSPDEISLVEKKTRIPKPIATNIVRVGAELRRQYKANEIPYGPSVGDLVNWGLLVSDGVPPETAAEETIVAMTSDNAEIQDSVRRVVQMIFGTTLSSIKSEPVENRQVTMPLNQKPRMIVEDHPAHEEQVAAVQQVAPKEEVVAEEQEVVEEIQPKPRQLNLRSMFSDDSEFSRDEF